jgi:hypothetical protein
MGPKSRTLPASASPPFQGLSDEHSAQQLNYKLTINLEWLLRFERHLYSRLFVWSCGRYLGDSGDRKCEILKEFKRIENSYI